MIFFAIKTNHWRKYRFLFMKRFFLVELKQVPPAAAAATLENLGEARASCDSLSFGAASKRKKKIVH